MSIAGKTLEIAKTLVTPQYIDSGTEALRTDQRIITSMVAQRKAPEEGLPDVLIENVMSTLSLMDSNNFHGHVGAGEREGRVFSNLVSRRHFHMAHGMGRSGELTADQPKAAGSSLMVQLTNAILLDFLKIAGAEQTESCIVVPMATGMSLSLVLSSLRKSVPKTAKYVIWPRIDQKTSLKCIYTSGFEAHVVELRPAPPPKRQRTKEKPTQQEQQLQQQEQQEDFSNKHLQVHVDDIEAAIKELGKENVVAVLSTTSCFAPRLPDDVLAISRLCKTYGVPYVVNNAYGVQSPSMMKSINAAMTHGRLDAFVQSGDKNFLVPVGGAVVAGTKKCVQEVSNLYAGRANSTPVMDLFITALSMGRNGFKKLLQQRQKTLELFHERVKTFAETINEEVMIDSRNDISFVMTLKCYGEREATELGAHLFRHCVTGPRVDVPSKSKKKLCGHEFLNYGTHSDIHTKTPMLVMACGLGMEDFEIDGFMARLKSSLEDAVGKEALQQRGGGAVGGGTKPVPASTTPAVPSAKPPPPMVPSALPPPKHTPAAGASTTQSTTAIPVAKPASAYMAAIPAAKPASAYTQSVSQKAAPMAAVPAPKPAAPAAAAAEQKGEEKPDNNAYVISEHVGPRTFVRHNQVQGQMVAIEYLKNCTVHIFDQVDCITIDDCENCEFVVAACENSIFVRTSKHIKLTCATKQLRTREVAHMDLRLFAGTDPVVESSHHITFRPFNLKIPNLVANMKSARLDAGCNRFCHVFDFTPEDASLPKPHFTVLHPSHGLELEALEGPEGSPPAECPVEVEQLLKGAIEPGESVEAGKNKSHKIWK